MFRKVLGNRLGAIILLLILTAFNVNSQTTVFFDVTTVFGTPPPNNTNRVFRLNSLSPFAGNFFYKTSDVAGQFYISNCLATTYSGTMLAPPNSIQFSFYVSATNLGVIPAVGITAIPANTVGTFPAGQTAYSAQASDQRYAPLGSSPFAALTAAQSTNLVIAATNNQTTIVYSNSAVFANTNQLFVTSNALAAANSLAITNLFATNAAGVSYSGGRGYISTNYDALGAGTTAALAIGLANTNFTILTSNGLQSQIGSGGGVSAATVTNVVNAETGVIGTNGASLTFKFSASGTNAILAIAEPLTNGFTDSRITNGFATQAYAQGLTNGFIASVDATNIAAVQAQAVTNGFIRLIDATNVTVKITTNYIPIVNGIASALIVTNTLTLTNGAVITYFFANGTSLRTNSISPFDWEFRNTNGTLTRGTSGTTKVTIDKSGNVIFLGSLAIGSGGFTNANFDSFGTLTVNQFAQWPTLDGAWILRSDLFTDALTFVSPTNSTALIMATNRFTLQQGWKYYGDGLGLTNVTATNLLGGALGQVTNVANSAASSGITNAYGTNYPNGNVANRIIYFPTNDPTVISNWFQISKVDSTNGTSFGEVASNLTTEGNVSFGLNGTSTNIIAATNFIAFNNAGSVQATNGAFVWSASMNLYTNWLNGAVLTNNGSSWLLQTNGVTLYSISGSNPIGTYSAINGAVPAPTSVYTAAINDHMVLTGYFSQTNIVPIFTAITNAIITTSNAFVLNLNGYGTNPTFIFTTALWGNSNYLKGGASAKAGEAILSGSSNIINGAYSTIVGGYTNKLDSSGSFDFIGGGYANYLLEGSSSTIMGGQYNAMSSANYSFIGGGYSNSVSANNGTIPGGANATITKDNAFVWSDGTAFTTPTNSQASVIATNGFRLYGPLWSDATSTNGGIYVVSNRFSLFAVTNAMPNFTTWIGTSNGFLVMILNSNGTPIMEKLWQ